MKCVPALMRTSLALPDRKASLGRANIILNKPPKKKPISRVQLCIIKLFRTNIGVTRIMANKFFYFFKKIYHVVLLQIMTHMTNLY